MEIRPMKKYLLSNRVRNAILLAILLQSVIFGIGLLVTGTFSGTVNRPYKVMESQVSEKNSLLSGYMNNVLLLSNTMEKELGRMSDKEEIQNRLIDNLNHSSSADGIFYIDLDNREALVFHDGEPDIYSSTYGDISCVIGKPESSYSIALARNWRPKLSDEDWADAGQFWDMRGSGGTWFFNDERMFYVLTQEKKGDRLIMGLETVDKGEFEVGETVKVSYVDQQHKDIDPNKSVYQVISGGNDLIRMGGRDINARAYLSRFNFAGADQEKLCGVLSGGERNRLHLAIALKEEGNVLLLDEPTNDIDVNTLRALEEGLEDFAGCAVVISHDRWFLDRICTHILAFEGDSNVFYFEGSYSEYEENKLKRLGNEEPKRVRYRNLMTD